MMAPMVTPHRSLVPLLALAILAMLAGQAEAADCPGGCPPNTQCDPTDGQCKPICDPWCLSEGRECGPDGCGASCGDCLAGQSCLDGSCIGECAPQCVGKECGDDGCGNQCGWCIEPTPYCTDNLCVGADGCVADCNMVNDEGIAVPKQCGDDGCGEICGICAEDFGYVCDTLNYLCIPCGSNPAFPCPNTDPDPDPDPETQPGCVPNCVGLECGTDGCGGTCGECAIGLNCNGHGLCDPCEPMCHEDGGSARRTPSARRARPATS